MLVGERGFEPPTHWSQTSCATKLRYSPKTKRILLPAPQTVNTFLKLSVYLMINQPKYTLRNISQTTKTSPCDWRGFCIKSIRDHWSSEISATRKNKSRSSLNSVRRFILTCRSSSITITLSKKASTTSRREASSTSAS